MGISSSISQPNEITEFRELDQESLLDDIQIPERAENRILTNRNWLFIYGILWILWVPFFIYAAVNSDTDRISGYDQYGNICGQKNHKYDGIRNSGTDFTNKKYLEYYTTSSIGNLTFDELLLTPRRCVSSCRQGYTPVLNVCMKNVDDADKENSYKVWFLKATSHLDSVAWQITFSCFFSLGVAVGVLFLFRYATRVIVWGSLVGSFILLIALTGFLWYLYSLSESTLAACVIVTIMAVLMGIVVIFARKSIRLVIALYREACKAIFAMPYIYLVPVVIFFMKVILIVLFVYIFFVLYTSGTLKQVSPGADYYTYYQNGVMVFTTVFLCILELWLIDIVSSVQYMIIAGSVSQWYFSKNKEYLSSPILTNTVIVLKYHLGSAIIGSLITMHLSLLRLTCHLLACNAKVRTALHVCLKPIETLLAYLSKNAFIVTAMHGQPFFKSGKRAATLLYTHIKNTIVVNSCGKFILGLANVMLLAILIIIALIFLNSTTSDKTFNPFAVLVVAVVTLLILTTVFSIFEAINDTIFICFCEDSVMNDGILRPYATSRELMEFMEDSKRAYLRSEHS